MVMLDRRSVLAPDVELTWKPQVVGRQVPLGDSLTQSDAKVLNGEAMDGLPALVRVLRHPELIFGPPSARSAVVNANPLDWERVASQLAECFEPWQGHCSDLHFQLHLGAAVLRRHGVKICSGGPRILFMNEDGPLHVFIQFSVDVSSDRVSPLNHELDDQVVDADARDGCSCFCFCFCSGESIAASKGVAGDQPIVA